MVFFAPVWHHLKQAKTLKFVPHYSIAFAGCTLKFLAILDGDVAAGVVNQASLMQHPCCQGKRGPGSTQHLAQELVGERHAVGLHTVVAGEKPASQALINRVQPVASGILGTLDQIRQQVLLQMTL